VEVLRAASKALLAPFEQLRHPANAGLHADNGLLIARAAYRVWPPVAWAILTFTTVETNARGSPTLLNGALAHAAQGVSR
jgi:hypothetical protein